MIPNWQIDESLGEMLGYLNVKLLCRRLRFGQLPDVAFLQAEISPQEIESFYFPHVQVAFLILVSQNQTHNTSENETDIRYDVPITILFTNREHSRVDCRLSSFSPDDDDVFGPPSDFGRVCFSRQATTLSRGETCRSFI